MPIADSDGSLDSVVHLVGVGLPGAETDGGNLGASVQSEDATERHD